MMVVLLSTNWQGRPTVSENAVAVYFMSDAKEKNRLLSSLSVNCQLKHPLENSILA